MAHSLARGAILTGSPKHRERKALRAHRIPTAGSRKRRASAVDYDFSPPSRLPFGSAAAIAVVAAEAVWLKPRPTNLGFSYQATGPFLSKKAPVGPSSGRVASFTEAIAPSGTV